MKILVCIKPDLDGEGIGLFEGLALEAGLQLREAAVAQGIGDVRLDVVTAGPSGFKDCLWRALGTGADTGIHLKTPLPESCSDPDVGIPGFLVPAPVTARLLTTAASGSSYDLILTGVMSQDLMAGQTGPMMAEALALPCATAVVRMELNEDGCSVRAGREMEGGLEEELNIPLPALVSIQSGFYTPRYPVLSHMLKAREKPVTSLVIDDSPRSPEVFSPPVIPPSSRKQEVVRGSLRDQVQAFKSFIRERGLV